MLKPDTCRDEPVAVQVNRVPETFEVNVIFVLVLVHIWDVGGLFERSGPG